jgi:ferritin-like metal-binding protein YciE
MPAIKVSNRRDLIVQLLGELYFVERRLHDQVLGDMIDAVNDEELKQALRHHREETKTHVERIDTAFRRLEVAATSNQSQAFEGAVAQHDDLSQAMKEERLADIFHAQAALHTEHWEMAAYRTLLKLVPDEVAEVLKPSFEEEGEAAKSLVKVIDRLADAG